MGTILKDSFSTIRCKRKETSIRSNNAWEDHVSMGENGTTKYYLAIKNLENILIMELLTASQALDLRKQLKSSKAIENMVSEYRKVVSCNNAD